MDTILVTGANRGIGLELVRCFLAAGHRVIGGCREPSSADALAGLAEGNSLTVCALDVTDADSVSRLASELNGQCIDVVVNNAGFMVRESSVDDVDYEAWATTFQVNSMAPLRVATAFKSQLQLSQRPRLVTVSSQMGSITRASAGCVSYRSSKAAVNMVMATLAQEWRDDGITVCSVHPGWVRTDMGGGEADLAPEKSAGDLARLIEGLDTSNTGQFFNHDGSAMPW